MTTPDINLVAAAVESFVHAFQFAGEKPREVQVRPSGDDVDVIKVWVDLGPTKTDLDAWAAACEADVVKNVPGATRYRVVVRAESLTSE
ncbi:MAG: hypothetical protein ACKV2T_29550 [Kofleriaceae bacterium]